MRALPQSAQALLQFWFGHAPDNAAATAAARHALWFGKSAAVDADLRARFGALQAQAAAGLLAEWADTPHGALALLLLLDQLPRNLFRGTPQAFACDAQALALAQQCIAAGSDAQLTPMQRLFVYLPLEHAENLAVQDHAVALFTALRDTAPAAERDLFEGFLDFAQRHRDIIARFGRFPHRNAILGRSGSEAEVAFLQLPGSGF